VIGQACEAHLDYLINNPITTQEFGHLGNRTGSWNSCLDVYILNCRVDNILAEPHTTLRAMGLGKTTAIMGPKVGIGWAVDNAPGEQILLLKVAWGGRNLAVSTL
jgi:hypothetical protein